MSADEADGRAHVVGEDEERRAVGLEHPAVQREPVHDRAHRVLADPEGDVAARVRRREEAAAVELGLRGLDEVGRAADHRRRERLERLHHGLARVARGDVLAGRELGQRLDPAVARAAALRPGPSRRERRGRPAPRPRTAPSHSRWSGRRARAWRPCARTPPRARRSASPDPSPSPPWSRAPRPRRAARRAPSPCPCVRGRIGDVAADDDQRRPRRSRPSPPRSRRRARRGRSRRRRAATCQP